jgi:hypothetical protein
VRRAKHALEPLRHTLDVDVRLKARRVHRLGRWRVHDVDAARLAQREIGVEGARIAREVLARPELQRVDEDADDAERRTAPLCLVDQGQVAIVQGAHGGHEAHALPFASDALALSEQRARFANDRCHRRIPQCVGP